MTRRNVTRTTNLPRQSLKLYDSHLRLFGARGSRVLGTIAEINKQSTYFTEMQTKIIMFLPLFLVPLLEEMSNQ